MNDSDDNSEEKAMEKRVCKDPGAVQHGNFINYYRFNSADARLELLPRDGAIWLSQDHNAAKDIPYLVLDVGCNTGELTQLLYQLLAECTGRKVYVLGVDIDAHLIERAKSENQHAANVSFAPVDVMNEEEFQKVNDFLQEHERCTFDAVCCFSITMWIHLNHSERGLMNFLQKLADIAELFVVEPQPWRCYKSAERRLKRANIEVFPLLPALRWRGEVEQQIQTYLETQLDRRKVYECCPTKWKRRICFYR